MLRQALKVLLRVNRDDIDTSLHHFLLSSNEHSWSRKPCQLLQYTSLVIISADELAVPQESAPAHPHVTTMQELLSFGALH